MAKKAIWFLVNLPFRLFDSIVQFIINFANGPRPPKPKPATKLEWFYLGQLEAAQRRLRDQELRHRVQIRTFEAQLRDQKRLKQAMRKNARFAN